MSAELTFNYPTRGEIPEAASDEWVLLRRDRGFEERVRNVLQELFLRGHKRVRLDYTPWNDFSAWSFRAHLPNFLEAFGADLLSRGIGLCIGDTSHRLSRTGERLQVRVSSGIDWFDLAVSAGEELDLSRIDLNDPLFSHGFVISGSRFIYIGAEDAEKLRQVIGLLDPSQKSPRVSRRNLEGAAVLSGLVSEPPLELARAVELSRALAAPSGFSDAALPSGFHGELRDYQRIGYGWLSFLAEQGLNGCLADDMGLGKTVQALALLQSLQEKTTGPSLVVAPVSTLRNWQSEAGRFTPTLNVRVHHGNDRPRDARAFQGVDLVIVSYATLRVDQEIFQKREWNVLILDEAQSIKNPGTRSFAVVKTLKSRHRFTLTGTPIENSIIDLWAQFDFLEPGLLGSVRRFRRLLGPRAGDSTDAAHQRLRRIVRPFILRRTKEVVEKSLPPKEEVRLFAEMGARQKAAYDALKEGYRKRIAAALKEKGIAGSGALIFEGLLRLRQAAGIPEHANASLKGTPSAKLALLEEVLEEIVAEGHRVLVFSQFVQTLSVIARALDQRKIPYAYLDGSTRDRQRVIDRFQADPGIPLFLLSLKAGGLGINLTAADYVVIFDPWWNPAVERQAVDRSHRIGQQKPVFVYRLITKESIEERILTLQEQKRTLAAELIEENPKSLLSLGEEELIGLFR
jgi:non-specific serine/threonine protein kinase